MKTGRGGTKTSFRGPPFWVAVKITASRKLNPSPFKDAKSSLNELLAGSKGNLHIIIFKHGAKNFNPL